MSHFPSHIFQEINVPKESHFLGNHQEVTWITKHWNWAHIDDLRAIAAGKNILPGFGFWVAKLDHETKGFLPFVQSCTNLTKIMNSTRTVQFSKRIWAQQHKALLLLLLFSYFELFLYRMLPSVFYVISIKSNNCRSIFCGKLPEETFPLGLSTFPIEGGDS